MTAAVVLAAGGGSRFGDAAKLRAAFRGRPLIGWAVDAALASGVGDVIVVVGDDDLTDVLPDEVVVVRNEQWRRGIATSLAGGIAAAAALGHDAVVVGLGDQPLVPAEAWLAVAAARTPVAVATYDGARRNPVRLDRTVWPLLPTDGDEGARVLMARRPELVGEVACPGDPVDIDTPEDLTRWS